MKSDPATTSLAAPRTVSHRVVRARTLARLLDEAVRVPGTRVRFGLDPLLGLIPGAGDLAGAALGGWVILLAAGEGAPRAMLLRMLGNIAVDTVIGTIPFFGDLFDVGFRANSRNVTLLERHIRTPRAVERSSRIFVGLLLAALVALVAGGIVLTVLLLRALFTA